jgi:hypothetical protein
VSEVEAIRFLQHVECSVKSEDKSEPVQFYFSSATEVVPEAYRRHWQICETIWRSNLRRGGAVCETV